jgi:aminoglycoside phosphotransferase family enzyme
MTRTRAKKPEFYQDFMSTGFFPDSNKIIKYLDSSNYWIFKTGRKVYKVKKKLETQSQIALDEIFCKDAVESLNLHSPDLETELLCVRKEEDRFTLEKKSKKKALYSIISMNQLSDRHFLDVIIKKGKITEQMIDDIAAFLVRFHEVAQTAASKEEGTPEKLNAVLQDLFYQSKKYLGSTISQAVIDMIFHPLEKFLVDNRKLFLRRIKKGYIKKVHGCFIPKKINIQKESVFALSRSTDPLKNRFTDVGSDVADLIVELNQAEQKNLAEHFMKKYSRLSGDKEAKLVVPFYRAMKCLSSGNMHSAAMRNVSKERAANHQKLATEYYEQIIDIVHKL